MRKMLALGSMLLLPLAAVADDPVKVFKTEGDFTMVRDSLQMAIEGKGLVINHSNFIAEMLERTGKDLGASRQVYVKGEQMEFCSAGISRRMMEADPHAIAMCPYIVSVYTLPDDPTVYLSYRKLPATGNAALQKAFTEIETLLEEIIEDAM